jgi:hypothetical protein
MMRCFASVLGTLAISVAVTSPAWPCSLCTNFAQAATLRQDAARAKLVLYGTLANPRLHTDSNGLAAGGTTDLHIERVLKSDPFLGDKKVIELPRYVPITDPKNPPKFLIFCDVFKGKLDPYRGVSLKSTIALDYLKGATALDGKDRIKGLLYFFDYLDHTDSVVSQDAFAEFAKATDQEIGQVAGKLSADKLRAWLQNPQTPVERLNLYGFLLGGCGGAKDADLLRSFVEKPSERTKSALSGLLSGYIRLRPREGWELALALLRDSQRPLAERFAVLGTVRFYHAWKPEEASKEVLRCLSVLLEQGDMADMAVEDLRRWQMWDLTEDVLAQYGKKSHAAPLVRRALVRYALSCPRIEATRFIAELRKHDPGLVADVEELMRLDKQP